MCIGSNVGDKGRNDKVDVKVVQAALNLWARDSWKPQQPLVVDGQAGRKTVDAIVALQAHLKDQSGPIGLIQPNSWLLRTLRDGCLRELRLDSLIAIMGHGNPSVVKGYFPLFQSKLPIYQINTPLRIGHFLAQVGHESLSFTYTEELASGSAYEGRADLGNTSPGDGKRFKGRGLIQLTGRSNYGAYGAHAGVDLLKKGNEQILANTPAYALDVSLWFWQQRKLNGYADRDDLRAITRRVNGGYNGLADRQSYLNRAKFFLMGV